MSGNQLSKVNQSFLSTNSLLGNEKLKNNKLSTRNIKALITLNYKNI